MNDKHLILERAIGDADKGEGLFDLGWQGMLDGLPVAGLALGDYTLFPLWVWIYSICGLFIQVLQSRFRPKFNLVFWFQHRCIGAS